MPHSLALPVSSQAVQLTPANFDQVYHCSTMYMGNTLLAGQTIRNVDACALPNVGSLLCTVYLHRLQFCWALVTWHCAGYQHRIR